MSISFGPGKNGIPVCSRSPRALINLTEKYMV